MDPPGDHEKQKFGRNSSRRLFRRSRDNVGRTRNRKIGLGNTTSDEEEDTATLDVTNIAMKGVDDDDVGKRTTSYRKSRGSSRNSAAAAEDTTNLDETNIAVTDEDDLDDFDDLDESFVKVIPPAPGNNNNGIPDDVVEQQKLLLAQAASHYNQRRKQQQEQKQMQQQMQNKRKSVIHKKAPSLSSYQTTPITKHYEVSRQILSAFDSHWSNRLWVTAYAVGLQFVETALLEIPKHGYFYSKRHERERMESSLEAARVAHLLQELLMHDEEETTIDEKGVVEHMAGMVPNGDLPRVQKLLGLALEQVDQASSDQEDITAQHRAYQVSRAEVEEELKGESDWVVCEPLLACSESFANVCGGGTGGAISGISTSVVPTKNVSPSNKSLFSGRYSISSMNTGNSNTVPTNDFGHPPLVSPPSGDGSSFRPSGSGNLVEEAAPVLRTDSSLVVQPPSLLRDRSTCGSVGTTMDEMQLEKALFLSGLEISEADEVGYNRREPPPDVRSQKQQTTPSLELSTVAQLYHEDFDSLQKSGRVRISFADTFQGRLPESTNGCTVIAPLLSIHHLVSELTDFHYETGGDPGLPDTAVEQCIDMETPVVLSDLRQRLGLSEHAFLIPADAHDYLIEQGQLSQSQFKTVSGGNILDDGHLQNFVKALEEAENHKIAATLFFHEHVVAILKLKRVGKGGKVTHWYDFIDSLPLKETLRRCNESPSDLCQRMGLYLNMTMDEISHENEMVALPRTARIRCLDAEALTAVIRWYACSKFTEENISYIDQYPWDDAASDFDPRVFQAFVWGGIELQ